MTASAARILTQAAPHLPDGHLTVALSGGPDSAVAAWLAVNVAPDRVAGAVFVDHRWPDSPAMEAAAQAVAAHLRIDLVVVAVDPTVTEGDARDLRLAALETAAAGEWIVTGHHADDQAETVLMHLMRGAGATGLAGIPPRRHPYVRPLLGMTAADLRLAADELGLPYADDPANRDPAHLRNRIRHEVMPVLADLRPGAARHIAAAAARVSVDLRELDRISVDIPVRYSHGEAAIAWGPLTSATPAVAAHAVRRMLRTVRPPYGGTAADVEAVVTAQKGTVNELSGGWRAEREAGSVVVHDPSAYPPVIEPTVLPVDGYVDVGRWLIACEVPTRHHRHLGRDQVTVDPSLGDHLEVRSAEEGERIDIGGGTKLVRDAMAEAGIPPRLRAGWPVVAAHGKIAWLTGARVAAWASVSAGPGALRLSMERR